MSDESEEKKAWVRGFCTALADIYRCLAFGFAGSEIVDVCAAASVTLDEAKKSGVSDFDLRALQLAGVK